MIHYGKLPTDNGLTKCVSNPDGCGLYTVNGLLPTNFLDLDICEILFVIYSIQKYIKLCFER